MFTRLQTCMMLEVFPRGGESWRPVRIGSSIVMDTPDFCWLMERRTKESLGVTERKKTILILHLKKKLNLKIYVKITLNATSKSWTVTFFGLALLYFHCNIRGVLLFPLFFGLSFSPLLLFFILLLFLYFVLPILVSIRWDNLNQGLEIQKFTE